MLRWVMFCWWLNHVRLPSYYKTTITKRRMLFSDSIVAATVMGLPCADRQCVRVCDIFGLVS